MATFMASRQLLTILGVMLAFMVCSCVTYYATWSYAWSNAKATARIGAEPLHIKVVSVVKDVPAGTELDFNCIDERYETLDHVAVDAYGFVAECIGRKTKWALPKGSYVSRHDLLPQSGVKP